MYYHICDDLRLRGLPYCIGWIPKDRYYLSRFWLAKFGFGVKLLNFYGL